MAQIDTVQAMFRILHLLSQARDGLSTPEIAADISTSRQSVLKYLKELQAAGIPIYDEDRRWFLDSRYQLPRTWKSSELMLLETILEHAHQSGIGASRAMKGLMQKFLPNSNPLPGSALSTSWSDAQSDTLQILAEARQGNYVAQVLYRGLRANSPSRIALKVYKFSIPVWSDALYVLGEGTWKQSEHRQLVTLKMQRILQARLTDEKFVPHLDTVGKIQNTHAWNIWLSDAPPFLVRVQFSSHLERRLRESMWHASQTITLSDEGYIIWEVQINELREIVPWIRAWGSDATVLEPTELRQIIAADLQLALARYTVPTPTQTPVSVLWAKYAQDTEAYHLLICHLLDVAAVAVMLWKQFSPYQRAWVTQHFSSDGSAVDEALILSICSLIIGLHDIGKASPGFQSQAPRLAKQLAAIGLSIESDRRQVAAHGIVSALILRDHPQLRLPKRLAVGIGGHHGEWITNSELNTFRDAVGNDNGWASAQNELIKLMYEALNIQIEPREIIQSSERLGETAFTAFLSGWASVADWIGSNEQYFSYQTSFTDAHSYFAAALKRAQEALDELGFANTSIDIDPPGFTDLFGFAPNAVQREAVQAFDDHAPPRLIIIEAPTGSGKTELALYAASWLSQLHGMNGFYIAMPTQATGNQMFQRAGDFLEKRFPDQGINYQLLHSQADLNPLYQELVQSGKRVGDQSGLTAPEWFTHRKRTLLSPYAVGTVDQALFAILRVRHFFVRLFGLMGRVIIFDEVHAYDTYMNELFERLLDWLYALGSPVILLSATLPSTTRERLIGKASKVVQVPYPRLTLVYDKDSSATVPLPAPPERHISVYSISSDGESLMEMLIESLREGGCAAIICNRVKEAQALAHLILAAGVFSHEEVLVFHAQFPPLGREQREREVIELFGKNGTRPHRAILIATQVVEQSLDLDFDIIFSSIAPIDLLLQRIGRLHRHTRERPAPLRQPYLVLRQPLIVNGLPDWQGDDWVYARYLLLQTWWLMQPRQSIRIPGDLDALIEAVYQETMPVHSEWGKALQAEFQTAFDDMQKDRNRQAFLAQQPVIPPPVDVWRLDEPFAEEPRDEASMSPARTRLMEPSVQIICLHRLGGQISLSPDRLIAYDLDRIPGVDEVRALMRCTLHIRRKDLKAAIEQGLAVVKSWQRTRSLADARAVIFEDGIFHVPNSRLTLKLTERFGLEIIEEEN